MTMTPEQWLSQADYDMETARFLFDGGRYFYAVFMCHLSIEKALKGLYQAKVGVVPPRTHNLVYLLSKTEIAPTEVIGKFFVMLNEAQVATRYPEDLEKLKRDYTRPEVRDVLAKGKEALAWIRAQL